MGRFAVVMNQNKNHPKEREQPEKKMNWRLSVQIMKMTRSEMITRAEAMLGHNRVTDQPQKIGNIRIHEK